MSIRASVALVIRMEGEFNLNRFVEAQAAVFEQVILELRLGSKRSHWMWFVFPQIAGLGHSPMSQRYAIGSVAEAKAYLAHPLLGYRLIQCCELLLAQAEDSAQAIFGAVDAKKLHSCATLFAEVSDRTIFRQVLARYFDSQPDPQTLARLP